LYVLVGEKEFHDPGHRLDWRRPGWPWKGMSPGYDLQKYPWGFGRTLFAVDPRTRRVLWVHKEETPIDGRAVCMSGSRIYYYSDQKFLACLDAKRGKPLWRSSDRKLLEAIGPNHRAQIWYRGMSTQGYMKCSDKAVYFAGPQRTRLVAVSTEDGRMLWQFPDGNFQLVLRDEGLYAMGPTARSPQGSPGSKLFDPLTGRILADLDCHRGNCARATGTIDSIFCRGDAHGGTLRLAVSDNGVSGNGVSENTVQRIAPMRPPCHDGVIAAGGMLYWGAWICDCNLSLVGNIGLSPAPDFQFCAEAAESERLWQAGDVESPVKSLEVGPGDWPTYRADSRRSAASRVDVPRRITRVWQHQLPATVDPAPPITAGGLVFLSGSDGVIRALDAADGRLRWKGYTGGAIRFPPAVDGGRLLAGSGDGWVYAFEAATGRRLWRFRAAPSQRKINLYGRLSSTWPVASGVLAASSAKGGPVVYAAAGIACYDGTHVYALDAGTGRIRWQNNTSGNLAGSGKLTGVSVQGHLLLDEQRLYLAGGNAVSPAVYDVQDGRCLNTLDDEWAKAPRGRELFLVNGKVVAFDRLLYGPKEYRQSELIPYQPSRYFARNFLQADAGEVLVRAEGGRIVRISPESAGQPKPKALWESDYFGYPVAMALGNNAVVVAGGISASDESSTSAYAIAALAVENGRMIWTKALGAMPTAWAIALDASGRIAVALEDGQVCCLAAEVGKRRRS
jgi:outer membrane protein assembly factor BamB